MALAFFGELVRGGAVVAGVGLVGLFFLRGGGARGVSEWSDGREGAR